MTLSPVAALGSCTGSSSPSDAGCIAGVGSFLKHRDLESNSKGRDTREIYSRRDNSLQSSHRVSQSATH